MKLRGHPIHPVVAIFPLALLSSSVALDLAALATRNAHFPAAARFALGASVIAGGAAAIPGILDSLAYPRAARGVPIRHGALNGAVVALALASWWIRRGQTGAAHAVAASPVALALSVCALALAVAARRLGMRLTPA